MCGILGVFGSGSSNKYDLPSMLSTLAHWGPDDNGIVEEDSLVLGHRRLSIMDEPFGYLPLHHLHLGMDERQSQPSSGGWARDGLIHLSEWFKDSLQVLRRYAYPRILNGDRPCCPSTSSKR